MKKYLSLFLCLLLAVATLVSCGDKKIGDGIKDYPRDPSSNDRLTLNMYIITDDETSSDAINAVANRIAGYTKTEYNTILNIKYVKESEYQSTVLSAIEEGGEAAPNIVLINDKDFFDTLNNMVFDKGHSELERKAICDLTSYYASKSYGRLNTQITKALLDASYVTEYEYLVIDRAVAVEQLGYDIEELKDYTSTSDAAELIADLEANGYTVSDYIRIEKGDYNKRNALGVANICNEIGSVVKIMTVPNNRVVGEYKYLVIDREVAHLELKYPSDELTSYISLQDAEALMAEMEEKGYNAEELVRIVPGPYELRESLSVDNFCNVIEKPYATVDEAFSSAFAIINNSDSKYNDRAMKIIYQLNNDSELRNLLQYGVLGANYSVSNGDIVRIFDGVNNYSMKLVYTGNIFLADNCSELGWTNDAKKFGESQNTEATFVK